MKIKIFEYGNKGYVEINLSDVIKKAGGWDAILKKYPTEKTDADAVINYLWKMHNELENEYHKAGYSQVGILNDEIDQAVYDKGYQDNENENIITTFSKFANEGLGGFHGDMSKDEAEKLAAEIKDNLSFIKDNYLSVRVQSVLTNSVYLDFAKGKDKTEWPHQIRMNDPSYISLMITADSKGVSINIVSMSYKIKRSGIKPIMQKRGNKAQIISYLTKWFSSNIGALNAINESLTSDKNNKETVKFILADTPNFEFTAIYHADISDDNIRKDFVEAAQKHMLKMKSEFDLQYWKSISEDLTINVMDIGSWYRDREEI